MLKPPAREGWVTLDTVDVIPSVVTVLAIAGLATGIALGTIGLPHLEPMWAFHEFGIMGPLCGATRAVALASIGDLTGAWRFNPLGVVLVVGAWAAVARALVGRTTGRWVTPLVGPGLVTTAVIGLLVLLTVRQQLRATYLLQNTTLP